MTLICALTLQLLFQKPDFSPEFSPSPGHSLFAWGRSVPRFAFQGKGMLDVGHTAGYISPKHSFWKISQ